MNAKKKKNQQCQDWLLVPARAEFAEVAVGSGAARHTAGICTVMCFEMRLIRRAKRGFELLF